MLRHADDQPFVSRGGTKLAHALDRFDVDPRGLVCADLGSHVGGFVEGLLQRGARKVYAVDTCYGTLAWKLRKDPRVIVLERTNALHVELPEMVDLITIDVGWTRQKLILQHARTLCGSEARIISLIKPHYEATPDQLDGGVLRDEFFDDVVGRVIRDIESSGLEVASQTASPIVGHGGNREVFVLIYIITSHIHSSSAPSGPLTT